MTFLHIGDHTTLRLHEFVAHVFETDHIVFAGLAVVIGVLAYRYGRLVEARSRLTKDRRP